MATSMISWLFLLLGAAFFAIAALGVVRFPDVYCRMHAVSKASSFGMGLILIGVGLHFRDINVIVKCALTIGFIFLTTPVAAHLLGRAAYLSGSRIDRSTVRDEIQDLYKTTSLRQQQSTSKDSTLNCRPPDLC